MIMPDEWPVNAALFLTSWGGGGRAGTQNLYPTRFSQMGHCVYFHEGPFGPGVGGGWHKASAGGGGGAPSSYGIRPLYYFPGGGGDLIKKQTNANQRQCTPQSGISASLFSMPNPVKPQDTHCV